MSKESMWKGIMPKWMQRGETLPSPNPELERVRLEANRELSYRSGYVTTGPQGYFYDESLSDRTFNQLNGEIRHYRERLEYAGKLNLELQETISNLKNSNEQEITELNERIEYLEFLLKENNEEENE